MILKELKTVFKLVEVDEPHTVINVFMEGFCDNLFLNDTIIVNNIRYKIIDKQTIAV